MEADIAINKPNLLQRISGIVFFKPTIYRYVALNDNLTNEAAMIAFLVAFITFITSIFTQGFQPRLLVSFLAGILISWLLISWLVARVASRLFKKHIPASFVIRTRGFATIYSLLFLTLNFTSPTTSLFTCFIVTADVLNVISQILSVREGCEISTIQALLITAICIYLPNFALNLLLSMIR